MGVGSWRSLTLGDVLTLQRGFDLPAQDRQVGDVPIVSSSGPSGRHSEARVRAPGVVIGRYGTIGQVFYMDRDFWPLNTTLWVKDFKGNDLLFCSYLLRTLDYTSVSDKSSVPGVNRNHLHTMRVLLPSLPEQRRIAAILGALDDNIALNRRMNATLEALARALFQSWFVDFDPVRAKAQGRQPAGMDAVTAALFPDSFEDSALGPIPRGWRVAPLTELAAFSKGASYKSDDLHESRTALVTLKSIERGGGYQPSGLKSYAGAYRPEQIVLPGEIVVAQTDLTQKAEVLGRPARVRATPQFDILVASLDLVVVRPISPNVPSVFLLEALMRPP